jgi:hypothetical protein
MTQPSSTSDYRQHPKGPNFRLIVILAGVAMIVIFIAAVLILKGGGKKLLPKVPDQHPTSQVLPLLPHPNNSPAVG